MNKLQVLYYFYQRLAESILNISYMTKIIRYRWWLSFEYFSNLSVHFQSKYRWQEKVLGVNFLG